MALPFLPSDIWNVIQGYLSYVDIMSARLSFRLLRSVLKVPDIVKLVESRLRPILGPEVDSAEFFQALHDSGAMLSGSFLLDVLMGTNFHQDVDIYDLTDPSVEPRGSTSFSETDAPFNGVENLVDRKLVFMQYLYKRGFVQLSDGSVMNNQAQMIRYFIHPSYRPESYYNLPADQQKLINPMRIQIIPLRMARPSLLASAREPAVRDSAREPAVRDSAREPAVRDSAREPAVRDSAREPAVRDSAREPAVRDSARSPIGRCILASYDLDICKNGFTGKRLYVRSWLKLIYRFDHMILNTRFLICTYRSHGEQDARAELMKRKQKYRDRGFNIQDHAEEEKIRQYVKEALRVTGARDSTELADPIVAIESGNLNLDIFSTARWSIHDLLRYARDVRPAP